MSEIKFTPVGVTSDGVPTLRSDEVQEMLYDLHTDHQSAIQQARIDAVREFVERLNREEFEKYCLSKGWNIDFYTVNEKKIYSDPEIDSMWIGYSMAKSAHKNHIEQLKEQGE